MLDQRAMQSTHSSAIPSRLRGDGDSVRTARIGFYFGYFGFAYAVFTARALRFGGNRQN